MDDTKEWFACEHCDGEFAVETDCSMKTEYCCFCGEPLDVLEWDEEYENFNSESEGT